VLDVEQRVERPEWPASDPRNAIRIRDLLSMTSGLRWRDPIDLVEQAFGPGRHDLASYAASQPLAHAPGSHFQYSDGTPSIVGSVVKSKVGGSRSEFARWLRDELFAPVGMRNTEAEFDQQGTWYGASGVRWSPCDLARFGMLLLRDGQWEQRQFLPAGWVDFMRTPSRASLRMGLEPNMPTDFPVYYGANVFVFGDAPHDATRTQLKRIDAFGHYGFGGNALLVMPSRDLVVVLVGSAAAEGRGAMYEKLRHLMTLASAFPPALHAETR
jgi:CubicO group peptidase (beta-lactamase class C family)